MKKLGWTCFGEIDLWDETLRGYKKGDISIHINKTKNTFKVFNTTDMKPCEISIELAKAIIKEMEDLQNAN